MIKENRFFSFSKVLLFLLLICSPFYPNQLVLGAPASQTELVYIIQKGDSLNTIALRFGVSAEDLIAANSLSDPNALNIGQRLIIPGLKGISGVLTSQTLPLGASLTGLMRQYAMTVGEISQINRITSPSETIGGVVFFFPIMEDQTLPNPVAAISTGETLLESAIRIGTTTWGLIHDNALTASWDILPGDILFSDHETETSPYILPGVTAIGLNNLPIIQGETLQVSIKSDVLLELSGKFNQEDLYFFSEDQGEYFSFFGIHALAEPGIYPLEVTAHYPDGSILSFEQLVLMVAGGYGPEKLDVPDEFLDEKLIEAERNRLEEVLSHITPERYWDGMFQYPIDEPCINSFFGGRRNYNNGSLEYYHSGLDFGVCVMSLNIYAAAAGKVVLAEQLFSHGKCVVIDHGWGVYSSYSHLSDFNTTVGTSVQPGDLIGQVGSTGRSTGPHLHFQINIFNTPVNPETWLLMEFPQSLP